MPSASINIRKSAERVARHRTARQHIVVALPDITRVSELGLATAGNPWIQEVIAISIRRATEPIGWQMEEFTRVSGMARGPSISVTAMDFSRILLASIHHFFGAAGQKFFLQCSFHSLSRASEDLIRYNWGVGWCRYCGAAAKAQARATHHKWMTATVASTP